MLATQAGPLYSVAWVYAGDSYYEQKKWPEAEEMFRKGVTIEPLNGQGWRFLSERWRRKASAPPPRRPC